MLVQVEPVETAPRTSESNRLAELDGLRALAILQVLLWHALVTRLVPRDAASRMLCGLFGLTWSGVDLFFVLSGFLIGGILLDHKSSPNYFKTFYLRRACRILPLYLLLLVPMFLVPLLGLPANRPGLNMTGGPFPAWYYLCFLQNFGMASVNALTGYTAVTWSLAVEEQFYLLLPLVVFFAPAERLPRFILPAIVASPLIRAVVLRLWPGEGTLACYVLLPCRWDSLLLGTLGAWLIRDRTWRQRLEQHIALLRISLVFFGAGYLVLAMTQSSGTRLIALAGYSWLAVFYAILLIFVVVSRKGAIKRFVSSPLLNPVATISYCLYLIQLPVADLIFRVILHRRHWALNDWRDVATEILALAVTFALAAISWRFFESKFIRWGHRFKYQPSPVVQADG